MLEGISIDPEKSMWSTVVLQAKAIWNIDIDPKNSWINEIIPRYPERTFKSTLNTEPM
jgi:hypothetical protein